MTSRGSIASRGMIRPTDPDPNLLAAGQLVPSDRYLAFGASSVASLTASQRLNLHYFTATRSETVTTITTYCGATAAGATPTLARMGVYEIAADLGGTLVASHANDTGLWAVTNTAYPKALTASLDLRAGQRYAVAALVVTAAAVPVLMSPQFAAAGAITETLMSVAPRVGACLTGQADLPASFTDASLAVSRIVFTTRLS